MGGVLAGLAILDTASDGGKPDPVLTGYGLLLGAMATLASGRRRAVVSGTVMATYAAALALLVHGLRDAPAVPTSDQEGP